jgi:gliding motility-associated-like protein
MASGEGCASVCDSTGHLLFYTDGMTVWNKSHQIMPNGSQIGGDNDDAQSALIIKQPGHDNIYYIFTNNRGYSPAYSVVDMSLNGGYGDIVKKNVTFFSNTNEGLAATLHCNRKDFWVTLQEMGSNKFCAFLFTASGLSAVPVESSDGSDALTMNGYIRFSPQGDKVAICKSFYNEIFRFNDQSGKLESLIFNFWYDGPIHPNYGFAFSPDGSKFYQSSCKAIIYQFDLSAGDSSAIMNSLYDIPTPDNTWSIQNGPDGKLYVTTDNHKSLSVIKRPDLAGSASNFMPYSFSLSGKAAIFGLPNIVVYQKGWQPHAQRSVSDACFGGYTRLSVTDTSGIRDVEWKISNPSGLVVFKSNNIRDSVILADSGKYQVQSIVINNCSADTLIKTVYVWPTPPSDTLYVTVCKGEKTRLSAALDGIESYEWSNGSHDSVIEVSEAGTYKVKLKRAGCYGERTFHVSELPSVWVALGSEYFICEDENDLVKLDAGKGFERYLWYPTGDTTQWIIVEKTGHYFVIVKDYRGCEGEAGTIIQRRCPGYLYFPNVFTPGKDTLNAIYKPIGKDIISYQLAIFNRWGEKLFETTDFSKGWNGTFKNQLCPEGIYVWYCSYSLLDKQKQLRTFYKSGNIELLRTE